MMDWREEIARIIAEYGAGFVRLGREQNGLYVSDYPRRSGQPERITAALREAGFESAIDAAGLARIDGTKEKYAALLAALPKEAENKALAARDTALYALYDRLWHGDEEAEPDTEEARLCLRALESQSARELLRLLPGLEAERQRRGEKLPRRLCRLLALPGEW